MIDALFIEGPLHSAVRQMREPRPRVAVSTWDAEAERFVEWSYRLDKLDRRPTPPMATYVLEP